MWRVVQFIMLHVSDCQWLMGKWVTFSPDPWPLWPTGICWSIWPITWPTDQFSAQIVVKSEIVTHQAPLFHRRRPCYIRPHMWSGLFKMTFQTRLSASGFQHNICCKTQNEGIDERIRLNVCLSRLNTGCCSQRSARDVIVKYLAIPKSRGLRSGIAGRSKVLDLPLCEDNTPLW